MAGAQLNLDGETIDRWFNREPIGFTHNLSGSDLFEFGSLRALAAKYHGKDCFVSGGASEPGQKFYAVDMPAMGLVDVLDHLHDGAYRALMKSPQDYDPRFRRLMDGIVEQVIDLLGGLKGDRIVRLNSSIFATSTATVTPFHFDPSVVFFCQIAGDKIYHMFPPAALSEAELEPFYSRGEVNIGQVDLAARDRSQEHRFALAAGKGLQQPQNAPHWVETSTEISISYSVFFVTRKMLERDRTRGFNHYLRGLGMRPAAPGLNPGLDLLKARTMSAALPWRAAAGDAKRALGRRLDAGTRRASP